MVFTKRERLIIVATVAALAVLILDMCVLTPLLDRHAAVQARKAGLVSEMERAGSLLRRRKLMAPRWRRMLAEGMKRDPAEAESQVLHALRDWSAEVRLNLSSLRPERSTGKSELPEIHVHAAGTGSMAAVSRFLWRLETAKIPIKVKMLRLTSRKEGLDGLSMQLRISTLYLPAETGGGDTGTRTRQGRSSPLSRPPIPRTRGRTTPAGGNR